MLITPYKMDKNAFSFYATSFFLTNKDIRNTRKGAVRKVIKK